MDVPLNWDAGTDVKRLRVGYLASAFRDTRQTKQTDANDRAALDVLRSLGVELVPVELPGGPSPDLNLMILADGADALSNPLITNSGPLKRQDRVSSNLAARFIPAVEYLKNQRLRTELMGNMARLMDSVDVYAVPFDYSDYTPNPVATRNTQVTNLTGHPSITLPHGFNETGHPTSITFIGKLYGEGEMMAVAKAYQDKTEWSSKHPPEFA